MLVCKQFFQVTLCIGRSQFSSWTGGKMHVHEKRTEAICHKRKAAEDWLDLLPKVPSHYCRSNISRTYVKASFFSKSRMYAIYYDYAKEHNIEIISRQLFCDILKEKKISIFKPRKDQCDICYGFKTGNVEITEYENHILKVREAEMTKEEAKNNCNPTRVGLQLFFALPSIACLLCILQKKITSSQFHDVSSQR